MRGRVAWYQTFHASVPQFSITMGGGKGSRCLGVIVLFIENTQKKNIAVGTLSANRNWKEEVGQHGRLLISLCAEER